MSNPINTWEQVGKGGVYISFVADSGRRGVMPSRAHVVRPGYRTDPAAHWSDNGCKTFVGKMTDAVQAAKAWAGARYGITAWKRNGMGDWINADAGLLPLRCEVERKAARAAKKAAAGVQP